MDVQAVIAGGAAPPARPATTPDQQRSASVYVVCTVGTPNRARVWKQMTNLVGGGLLYGVSLGKAFFGERKRSTGPRA